MVSHLKHVSTTFKGPRKEKKPTKSHRDPKTEPSPASPEPRSPSSAFGARGRAAGAGVQGHRRLGRLVRLGGSDPPHGRRAEFFAGGDRGGTSVPWGGSEESNPRSSGYRAAPKHRADLSTQSQVEAGLERARLPLAIAAVGGEWLSESRCGE